MKPLSILFGCLIGLQVKPDLDIDFLLGKEKMLASLDELQPIICWRAVLLRHVIHAIPIFYFMAMALDSKGFKRLEGVC